MHFSDPGKQGINLLYDTMVARKQTLEVHAATYYAGVCGQSWFTTFPNPPTYLSTSEKIKSPTNF